MTDGAQPQVVSPDAPLSIVVVGASGHLAKTKILPALFSLYCQGYLPENFNVTGFARREMSDESFRNTIRQNLFLIFCGTPIFHLTHIWVPEHIRQRSHLTIG